MTDTTTDLQDPLPESSWFWRRVFVFVVTAVILFFLWGAMDKLGSAAILSPDTGIKALVSLCKWLVGFSGVMCTFYLVAPSAELVVKALQVTSLLKANVQFAARQTIDSDGASDTATTAGKPPAPPVPASSGSSVQPGRVEDPPWAIKH